MVLPTNPNIPDPPASWAGRRLLVAVSGGADSTALLVLLAAHPSFGPARLRAAHVNYHLRGAASAADEASVRRLCASLGVKLFVKSLRPGAKPRASLQDWARKVRYAFFASVARREKAWGVATAHHLDDQAETVLDRLLRGAGLRGLGALRPVSELPVGKGRLRVWRPLLSLRRSELETFLRSAGRTWRKDASNESAAYRRNRIRLSLLPLLRGFNPRVEEALAHLAETASAEDALLDRLARESLKSLSPRRGLRRCLWDADLWGRLDIALQRRALRLAAEGLNPDARGLNFERLEEARKVLLGETRGPRDLGSGLSACRDGSRCVLRYSPPAKRSRRPEVKSLPRVVAGCHPKRVQ